MLTRVSCGLRRPEQDVTDGGVYQLSSALRCRRTGFVQVIGDFPQRPTTPVGI
jgi:hypothetical protein